MARHTHENTGKDLRAFFILVFAFSAPFWLLGASGVQLIPRLPVSAVGAIAPAAAALILVARREGRLAAIALLKRSFDAVRITNLLWLAPIILLMPALLFTAYILMSVTGASLPTPHLVWGVVPALFLMFFVGGIGEELGWSGYAINPMQVRLGALPAALALGLIWAGWHLIPFMQTGRSIDWIVWHALVTVATRVLAVWLYNNTGQSVFGAALFHAMCNVAYFMFPNGGSHYSPRVLLPVMVLVIFGVLLVQGPTLGFRRREAAEAGA